MESKVIVLAITSVRVCTGWQSQGSAWKRYVAQAADAVGSPKTLPLLSAGPAQAPAERAQPEAATAPEPSSGQPGGQAGREPAMAAPLQSAPATPAPPLPVQLSLERLQEQRRSSIGHIPAGAGPLLCMQPYDKCLAAHPSQLLSSPGICNVMARLALQRVDRQPTLWRRYRRRPVLC